MPHFCPSNSVFGQCTFHFSRGSVYIRHSLIGMLLASCLTFKLGPPFVSPVLLAPCTTACCILGTHVFWNLRLQLRTEDTQLTPNLALDEEESEASPTAMSHGTNSNSVIVIPLFPLHPGTAAGERLASEPVPCSS